MRKCAFLLVLVLLPVAELLIDGCIGSDKPRFTEESARIPFAQKTGFPEASDGFVLAVGGETITSDEIIGSLIEHNGLVVSLKELLRPIAQTVDDFEDFREQANPEVERVLTSKLSYILLYQQAKRKAGDIEEVLEKVAEREVRKFIGNEFDGDYARAEESLKQKGMDLHSFKEYWKKKILVASQLPRSGPITYSELLDCYNEMKDGFFVKPAMLKFRLIDIEAGKLEVADPNQNQLERARELADELVGRIRAGEDFGKLARQYSHGHRRLFGGLWKPRQPQSLAEPYDVLASSAERIEPGQIAGPIEAGEHIFIMKLEEKQAKSFKPLRDVQREVEQKIIFDRQKQAREEIMAKLVQQTAIGQRSEFVDFCLKEIYQMSNQ